jgi:hypothetical protein
MDWIVWWAVDVCREIAGCVGSGGIFFDDYPQISRINGDYAAG